MILFWLSLAALVALNIRNVSVYRYRRRLLVRLTVVSAAELGAGRVEGWTDRFDWWRSVPYSRMVFEFWRPLDSFYPDSARWLTMRAPSGRQP